MDAELLHPACQAARVIAHTGREPMLRRPLDLEFALVRGNTAADLSVAGKSKGTCSETTVDRTTATAAEKIDRGCSLLAKK